MGTCFLGIPDFPKAALFPSGRRSHTNTKCPKGSVTDPGFKDAIHVFVRLLCLVEDVRRCAWQGSS